MEIELIGSFIDRLHGKDNIAIKRYVISFWNGIDLRYKLLKGPSVKISIAGIIISRVRNIPIPAIVRYIALTIIYGPSFGPSCSVFRRL